MFKNIFILYFFLFSIIACKQQKNNQDTTLAKKIDTVNFYPLNVMLDNQIGDLKKSPYYIYKKTTRNSILVDSIPFSLDSFSSVIQQLKQYNIDTIGKKEYYKESSFQDLTTNSISLVYTTTSANMEVINQTILLNQETNTLKNAFVRILKKSSNLQIQYNFKPNKSLRISTININNGEQKVVENVFINWNDTQE